MNLIAQAVEPKRQDAIQRARDAAKAYVDRKLAELAAAGWDLNKVAPVPHSAMTRSGYRMAQDLRCFLIAITTTTSEERNDFRGRFPKIVTPREQGIENYIDAQAAAQNFAFDSYVAKLTKKVGDGVTKAEIDSGYIWDGSVLTVTKGATVEQWRTRMILNVSVLGKLFNQWPTRKIGRGA